MINPKVGPLDEIDRILLRILSENPRKPYSEIAEELQEEGFEMSGEGIRNRVGKLFESTSAFFLLAPEEHEWELFRLSVTVAKEEDAKQRVLDQMAELDLWLVCASLGVPDIYAVGTAVTTKNIDDVVSKVRSLESVEDVDLSIETARHTNIHNYFPAE